MYNYKVPWSGAPELAGSNLNLVWQQEFRINNDRAQREFFSTHFVKELMWLNHIISLPDHISNWCDHVWQPPHQPHHFRRNWISSTWCILSSSPSDNPSVVGAFLEAPLTIAVRFFRSLDTRCGFFIVIWSNRLYCLSRLFVAALAYHHWTCRPLILRGR